MKSTAKKIGFWLCVGASVLVIGNTVAGWFPEKAETEDNKTEVTQTLE